MISSLESIFSLNLLFYANKFNLSSFVWKYHKKNILIASHKKRKDSLKSSQDRVLFVTELELPEILASTQAISEYIKFKH